MTSLTDKIHWYAGAGQLIKVSHDCGSFSSWSVICAIFVLPQDNFKMPRSFLIKKKPEKATRNAVHDSKAKGEPWYSLRALVRCPKGNKCIVANKSCSPNLRLRPLNISLICSPELIILFSVDFHFSKYHFWSETSAKQHFSGIAYLSYHELNCMLSFRNQQVVNLTSNKKRFQILHLFENLFSKTRVYSHGSILRHLTYILPKLQLTKFLTVTYIQRNQHRNTKWHRQLW